MSKTRSVALLLALSPLLAGCDDADELTALSHCQLARLEKAPTSTPSDYMVPCMRLKYYKYVFRPGACMGGISTEYASCYEPDGDLARIRRNIFGKKP